MAKKCYSVLLVDDSSDDRLFVRRAFGRHPGFEVIAELCNGEEAITYLAGEGQFSNREEFPLPDLLVLDLKMPKKSGHEVLVWMQGRNFGKLHVVVLSGSFLTDDITRSMELGAHAYFKKEGSAPAQREIVAEIAKLLKAGAH